MWTSLSTQLGHCTSESNGHGFLPVKLYLQQQKFSLRTIFCDTYSRPSVPSKTKSLALDYVFRCYGVRRIELLHKSVVVSFIVTGFSTISICTEMCVCVCVCFGTYVYGYLYTMKNIYLKIRGKRVVGQDWSGFFVFKILFLEKG